VSETVNGLTERQGIYLLSHSVGLPLPNAERAAAKAFWTPWETGNGDIWQHWLGTIEAFRAELALLLNSNIGNICPQSSLSSAVGKVIYSLDLAADKKVILLSEEDFPSIAFALQKGVSSGYTLKFIDAGADTSDMTIWRSQMTEDVGLVLVTHVQSNNGRQLPVQQITDLARSRQILSLVDVAQSVGILPINLAQWQADFVVGSCVKWIGGGPGAAFLWVDSPMIEHCQPQSVGWFSHQDPFEFDIHHFRYADDALRFWGGTPTVYPFAVAANSVQAINAIGVNNIRQNNLELSDQIIQAVPSEALISPVQEDLRGGTLVLDFGRRQDAVMRRLINLNVHFDCRVKGMRLSPHTCNNEDQIGALIKCF
jgi:kynureninase|tara:strand:- start:398 stop:1504 length:1107 start_codon:yes stop_codon:yes gene_type:complete